MSMEEYKLIINTIRSGFVMADGKRVRPNPKVANCLILGAQMGLRIGDITRLKLNDIVQEGGQYRLNYFEEQKTKKTRHFIVPKEVYIFLQQYALDNGIKPSQRLFDISVREIQHHLQLTCKYLKLRNVGTHSMRKLFAQKIYENNGFDMLLVQELLQHSNITTTRLYLGVSSQRAEQALQNHIVIDV